MEKQLNEFKINIDKKIDKYFNKKIDEQNDKELKKIFINIKKYVISWGKRIRPYFFYKINNDFLNLKNIDNILIAFEFLHASSLLDDDILDGHDMRRWKPTIPTIYKNKNYNWYSIWLLAANILRWLWMDLILESKLACDIKNDYINIYQSIWKNMDLAQVLDLEYRWKLNISEKKYINMIDLWSSIFIAYMFKLWITKKYEKHFFEVWRNLGIAFQLIDDLIDIDNKKQKWRPLGADIIDWSPNLLSIYTYKKLNNQDKEKFKNLFGKNKLTDEELKWIITQYENTWSIKNLKSIINKYINNANNLLMDVWVDKNYWLFDFWEYNLQRIN